jgi:hypothetical protein
MPSALTRLLRPTPLTPDKVAFAWRVAVGTAMAHAATVEYGNGVLRVRARDEAWQGEVERSLPLVRARLDALLGNDAIERVDVVCEGASDGGRPARRRERTRPR